MASAAPAGVKRELPAIVGGGSIVAALLLIAMLLAFGWSNWPSADDFCNTVLVKTGGISGAMHWLYTQWSGRVFTGIVMYTMFGVFDIPSLRIASALLAAAFAFSAWQMSRLVTPSDERVSPPIYAFVLAVLVTGLYPLLGQAVFWPTGGVVYLVPLILLLHWLQGLRRLLENGTAVPPNVHWFLVSVALGNSIELVVPVAVAYLAIVVGPRWSELTPAQRKSVVLRAAGVAIGATVLVTAPGNFLRGEATPGSFDLHPIVLLREYVRLWSSTASVGVGIIAASMAVAVAGLMIAGMARRQPEVRRASGRWAEIVALILGGCATLIPVLAAPAQFAPRNGLYMLICFFMAGMMVLVAQLEGTGRAWISGMSLLAAIALLGTLLVLRHLTEDYELASLRREQQVVRDAFLRDAVHRGADVELDPIRPYPPSTLHAIDVTPDSTQIVNQCVARYYDVHTVHLAAAKAK